MFALENASKYIDPQMRPLLNDAGTLRVAMAFVPRAGGAMMVAGPDAQSALKGWLESTTKSKAGNASRQDLAAFTFAVDGASVERVLHDPNQAIRLNAAA